MDSIADRRAASPPLTRRIGGARSRWELWESRAREPIEVFVAREPDARFHLHWHEDWSLGAIARGSCAFSCDGRRAVARAGDLVLIPPFAVHTARTSSIDFEMVMLYLPVGPVARRLGLAPGRVPVLARHCWRQPTAARALSAAVRERRMEAVWPLLAAGMIACRASPPADRAAGPVDPRVARISAVLQASEAIPRLADLASSVGMSREHLHRIFRAALGVTPGQYLRLGRVALARRMLRRGDRIAEVALACGFTDQAHFSRWFRRYLGVTPREFATAARAP